VTDHSASHLHGRFRSDPDVVARRVQDEVVLVQLGRNQVYALNRTGARLWELMVDGCRPSEAVECMLEEFDVAEPELRGEIDSFLDLLLREGLLSPKE
jgi:hypothetical protein